MIDVKLAQDRSPSPDRLHFFGILRDIDSTSGHKQPEEALRTLSHESQQWAVKEWLGRQAETK